MSFLGNGVGRQQVLNGQLGAGAVAYSNLDTSVTTPMIGFKNKLINGNFDIWQRGTSTSAVGYLADRWGLDAQGSPAFTQSRQAFALGTSALDVPAKYYWNVNVTSSGDAAAGIALLRQRIESVDALRGTVTVSFWAACDAGKKIGVNICQFFGTGGSPSASVYVGAQTITPTTSFAKYTLTFTVPSIIGKTLGTNGDDFVEVEFYFTSGTNYATSTAGTVGAQTGNFNIAQVQLENGVSATKFDQRPLGTELALAQRYYYRFSGASCLVFQTGSSMRSQNLTGQMRGTVTFATNCTDANNSGASAPGTNTWSVSAIGIAYYGKSSGTYNFTSAGGNGGAPAGIGIYGATPTSGVNELFVGSGLYVEFNAEL